MATTSMAKPKISTRACPTGLGQVAPPPQRPAPHPTARSPRSRMPNLRRCPNATRTTLSAVSSFSSRVERRSSVNRAGRLPVIAAIGDTRRARKAGQMADTAVTTTPTKIAARMALPPHHDGCVGQAGPEAGDQRSDAQRYEHAQSEPGGAGHHPPRPPPLRPRWR